MKLDKLENILKSYNKITVALSGGVDSAFLLTFACKVLGSENVRAVTACGPHLAADEVDYAKALCASLGVDHAVISMDHIMPILTPNPQDRCYHCKKAMFEKLKTVVAEAAAKDSLYAGSILSDGTNLDDMDDYRPGHKALAELKIASPLKDAGLTKADIRKALEGMAEEASSLCSENSTFTDALILPNGMPIWEKPAFACLASRIPYGETITEEKLEAVYKAESFLRNIGFNQVRVRHHGDIARIEVPAEEKSRFFDEGFMDNVNNEIKKYGFKFAVLDLGGYRMGGGFHDGKRTE